MKLLLLVIIIIKLSYLTLTQRLLSSDELCNKAKYQTKCPDNYNFTCKSDKCTLDMETCKRFNHKKYHTLHAKSLVMFQSNLGKYEKFLKSIKKCESDWQPNKVCLNLNNCSALEFNNSTKKFTKYSRKCKCTGEHSFGCGKLCAVDRKTCDSFNSEAKINRKIYQKLFLNKIKECYTFIMRIMNKKFS